MAYVRVVAEINEKVGDQAKRKAQKEEVAMKYVIETLLKKWIEGKVKLW